VTHDTDNDALLQCCVYDSDMSIQTDTR
jgi:hypothetical protein